ncbi:hypothetical protein AgCh_020907 [Apium graveolens]
MSAQKLSNIKTPVFEKVNYTLWKKKVMLFIRMDNPLYLEILKHGPFILMMGVLEATKGDMVIPGHFSHKGPSTYTEPEKEKVSLDSNLQLILIESLDNVMYNNIINCELAKQIWEKVEIPCEGNEEVSSNQIRILVSQYQDFIAKPKEGITKVFERFNKLKNDLQLHDKYYEVEERKLLKLSQGHVIDVSSVLIANDKKITEDETKSQTQNMQPVEQKNKEPQKQVILELEEDEYYTLDELDEMDQSMAYMARKFSNIRVKKPRYFKGKGQTSYNNNWKGKTPTNETGKGGYKKPKKVKKDKAYLELEAKSLQRRWSFLSSGHIKMSLRSKARMRRGQGCNKYRIDINVST